MERHGGTRPVEFPLSLRIRNAAERYSGARPVEYLRHAAERHSGARPVEFLLSLTAAQRHAERSRDACPVEFPLSLTDSERRGTPDFMRLPDRTMQAIRVTVAAASSSGSMTGSLAWRPSAALTVRRLCAYLRPSPPRSCRSHKA